MAWPLGRNWKKLCYRTLLFFTAPWHWEVEKILGHLDYLKTMITGDPLCSLNCCSRGLCNLFRSSSLSQKYCCLGSVWCQNQEVSSKYLKAVRAFGSSLFLFLSCFSACGNLVISVMSQIQAMELSIPPAQWSQWLWAAYQLHVELHRHDMYHAEGQRICIWKDQYLEEFG